MGLKITNTRIHHVVGVGYGDEGKGSITSKLTYLINNKLNSKVSNIRYGGGMQVGHTTFDGEHYIENRGVPSCTHVNMYYHKEGLIPIKLRNELHFSSNCIISFEKLLESYNEYIKLFSNSYFNSYRDDSYSGICINLDSPISTFLDVYENRIENIINQHGSTGLGIGKTVARMEDPKGPKLYVKDITEFDFSSYFKLKSNFEDIILEKLHEIAKYYRILTDVDFLSLVNDYIDLLRKIELEGFCTLISPHYIFPHNINYSSNYTIFEGHQGALLDKDSSDFPYVTRSKTTSVLNFNYFDNLLSDLNLGKIIDEFFENEYKIRGIDFYKNEFSSIEYKLLFRVIFYEIEQWCIKNSKDLSIMNNYTQYKLTTHMVTRIYSTRHGNGPFIEDPIILVNNAHESNHFNPYQLSFKTAKLNLKDLERGIKYVIRDLAINFITAPIGYTDPCIVNYIESLKNLVLHVTCCDQVDIEYFYKTITEIENLDIVKNFNIKIKTHETNDFRVW